jgi:hypothetical protein
MCGNQWRMNAARRNVGGVGSPDFVLVTSGSADGIVAAASTHPKKRNAFYEFFSGTACIGALL